MSRLFVELYLDEDVDVLVADMLRAYGHAVETTREAARLGASDAEQLVYACSRRRVLLTHNRVHFERLVAEYFNSGRDHSGVFFAVRRTPQEMVRRLLVLLNEVSADEMVNQVRYL